MLGEQAAPNEGGGPQGPGSSPMPPTQSPVGAVVWDLPIVQQYFAVVKTLMPVLTNEAEAVLAGDFPNWILSGDALLSRPFVSPSARQ